jgi:UDP-N-acetylglucosamine--N-acetylmuramyl-(pentapeptide) pyrophosphoryl-undecaprenol N-acetylglucosamine transferase
LKRRDLEAYRNVSKQPIDALGKSARLLEDIRALAGPDDRGLRVLDDRVSAATAAAPAGCCAGDRLHGLRYQRPFAARDPRPDHRAIVGGPMSTVLFAGGGTGGHLMPALAIADAMVKLDSSIQPYFVGAERGVEARVLPARPWRHELLAFEPIYRKQWWKNWRLPVNLAHNLSAMKAILRRETPVLAVGTGGYASGPALWAASGQGIPTVLQEQNAFPGFATKRLAGRARQIHLGFPEGRKYLRPGTRTEIFDSGNPIVAPDEQRARVSQAEKTILVLGGSQGSLAINKAVSDAISAGAWPANTRLIWQTGAATYDQFKAIASRNKFISAAPFLDPIADAYRAASLVICRAGAMTIAEVQAWGLPSILIPLPTASANHQLINAQALANAGAAALLEQHALTGASLASVVRSLLADPIRMNALSQRALERARPRAAEDIARAALSLL